MNLAEQKKITNVYSQRTLYTTVIGRDLFENRPAVYFCNYKEN